MSDQPKASRNDASRRDFLKGSALAGVTLASGLGTMNVHASSNETIKVGLIGCGGRGTGAALDAMAADENIQLVALGDAFKDRLDSAKDRLQQAIGSKFAVKDDTCFVGFDAYKHVIDCSDVVLLGEPPHFRPKHIQAAIAAGKHVFAEKPVAVDGPGVRSVLESCRIAKEKGLSVVSGLCWRYHEHMRQTVQKVHEGAIGDVIAMQCNYNTRRPKPYLAREEGWSDMEYQLRNWYYYTWLSGDHNVEQHIHSLDKMAWIMKDVYPAKCFGLGGRQAISPDEPGNIYDHHAVCYEFPNGVRCYSYCRQQVGTKGDVSDHIMGTKGTANLMGFEITGENKWKIRTRRGEKVDMYQQEHKELFASIRAGKPINNGEYMCFSTLMAIMGRMAGYTGQEITWEQALNSKEDLSPPQYDWVSLPTPEIATPGYTKFA